MKPLFHRLQSIDIFRAVTMFLMIFVNDFDGVTNVPEWIKHAKASEDALGFADTIFPAFLFILGLSIPIALQNRLRKGQTVGQLFVYVLLRSIALLVMGIFQVNLENYSNNALLPLPVWEIIITIAFFLIWIDYPATATKNVRYALQILGVVLLSVMAMVYKGESEEHLLVPLQPQWYGILGLLGWSYLICASIFLAVRSRLVLLFIAWLFFFLFSVGEHAGLLHSFDSVHTYIWIVGSGSMPAFTMAGVFVFVLYQNIGSNENKRNFWLLLFAFGAVTTALGFLTRPLGGISKIHDTPSWIGICTGISVFVFAGMVYLVDIKKKSDWFSVIKPAGTVTLVCYFIPYLLYSMYSLVQFRFAEILSEGWGGLIRSLATAFIVILIAGRLEKRHIRLKI